MTIEDKKVNVKAAKGVRVPTEEHVSEYITDGKVVTVPLNAWHRRRIADGDLIVQSDTKDTKKGDK